MSISTIVLFASSIALATSTVFINAPCPAYEAVPDFSLDKYKGVWYEIATYPDNWEENSDCASIEYFGQNNYKISHVTNHKRVNMTGTVRVEERVLYHDSLDVQRSGGSYVTPVKIVSVDYNEYAIVYSCVYDDTTELRHDFFWLTTRNRDKKDKVIRRTADIIKSLGYIDTTKFVWMNLTNESCLM